jgi:PAS domain S-box-containing protein
MLTFTVAGLLTLTATAIVASLFSRGMARPLARLDAVERSSDLIATLSPEGLIRYASPSAVRVLGVKAEDLQGKSIFDSIHADDSLQVREALARRSSEPSRTTVFRFRHADGTTHILEAAVSSPEGQPADKTLILNARDITDRMRAERELRGAYDQLAAELAEQVRGETQILALNDRLFTTRDEERVRIARELHDDFSQQIAALSISVSNIKQQLPNRRPELAEQIDRLQQRLIHLAESIRHLSHELHPATLEHAGLGPALRSYCAEFGALNGLSVACHTSDDFRDLSSAAALCIYRVTEEALQNFAKHAQTKEANVELVSSDGTVSLTVTDQGVGCLPGQTRGGLGMASMRARVRLADGVFEFKSEPQRGTSVRVSIPLVSTPCS